MSRFDVWALQPKAKNRLWEREQRRKRIKDALWIALIIALACLASWLMGWGAK
jgi:hypothetical protein